MFMRPERSMMAFGLAAGSDAVMTTGSFRLGDVTGQAAGGSAGFAQGQLAGQSGLAEASASGMRSIAADSGASQAGIVGDQAARMGSSSLPGDVSSIPTLDQVLGGGGEQQQGNGE